MSNQQRVEVNVGNRCQNCGKPIGDCFVLCLDCSKPVSDAVVDASEVIDDIGDALPSSLPLNVRRRYARAKSVFEVGIWSSRSEEFIYSIMMGSMSGVRNSYAELRLDNRRLRYELKKLGLYYADCFCGEMSPESHDFIKRDGSHGITVGNLWHMHGFMRFDEKIAYGDLHSVLSPLWGKIHGSQVVDVKVIDSFERAIKYMVKDAVKDYVSDDNYRKRLMLSDSWLPSGYRKVNKVLNKWALLHRWNWDEEFAMPDQGYAPRLEYVPFVWDIKRELLQKWCCGEELCLDLGRELGWSKVVIRGSSIIYEGGEKESDS